MFQSAVIVWLTVSPWRLRQPALVAPGLHIIQTVGDILGGYGNGKNDEDLSPTRPDRELLIADFFSAVKRYGVKDFSPNHTAAYPICAGIFKINIDLQAFSR